MQGFSMKTKTFITPNVVRMRFNLSLLITFHFDIQYHSIGHS